jgi:hypothetical protein
MAAKQNYTDAMVEKMVAMYEELGNEGLEQIAETIGRGVRSVRSKLVREGVYVADVKPKAAAKRDEGPTKKELLNRLEEIAPFGVDGLMGATKAAISDIIAFVESVQEPVDESVADAAGIEESVDATEAA